MPPAPVLPTPLGRVTVSSLSCPKCGGAVEADAGQRVITCPYCHTALLALGDLGIRRFSLQPSIEAPAAKAAAKTWLGSGMNKDSGLASGAEMGDAMLVFLPFFRLQADVIGYVLGVEERSEGSGNNRRTVRENVERPVSQSFDRTFAAVNVEEWGVESVRLPASPALLPFDEESLQRRGMVFAPTVSERETAEEALASYKQEADPGKSLKEVRFRFLETVRERLSVLYVPLWAVRYRYRNRSYTVLIDAADGSLAYGKAPGNDFYRAVMMVGSQAAACFLGTTIIQHSDDGGCVVFAGIAALVILAFGWRSFRYGGEVIEGSGVGTRSKASGFGKSLLKLASRGQGMSGR
ncbi:MAG: hypothetical protein ABI609_12250 [Acidobacteriota bacterium]